MAIYDYDWLVIGSGPAGEKAATAAAFFGKRCAVVEMERDVGGACVNTGTLPSKTLRETAIYLSGFRQRELYGVSCHVSGNVSIPDLMCRQAPVINSQRERLVANLKRHNIDLLSGKASFLDEHTLELMPISGVPHRVTADAILIATGSSPFRPEFVPFEDPEVDDSDSILALDAIPRSLVILGGGVIGCEYASIFAALGTKVSIVEGRSELLGFLDGEIARTLSAQMQKLGIDLLMHSEVVQIDRKEGVLTCTLADGRNIPCERLLFAGGRAGNTRALRLDRVGVRADARGLLKTDEHGCVVGAKGGRIYAAGDVVGFPALASVAMEQGRIAALHAFNIPARPKVTLFPYGLYTIPEVSMIGESEESAKKKGIDYLVGHAYFRDSARGQIVGDTEGIIKLIFGRDKKILGVHIIGERATELIHIGAQVIHFGGTLDDLVDQVYNFPTLGDMFKYAAYDGLSKLISSPLAVGGR